MSFGAPLGLLALALVPLVLAAYLLARRRRRRYAIRFPGVSVIQQAAGGRRSWDRHLPLALVLAAVAVLAIALARPRERYRVPVGQADVMLVSDHSGSMAADDVAPTRLQAAIKAANIFMDQLPNTVALGAVTFSSTADQSQAPITNHAAARSIIDGQSANGGTDTGDALLLALQLLHATNTKHPPSAIVLLSDGAANAGPAPVSVAQQAKQAHIPIDTVALGTPNGVLNEPPFGAPQPVPPDPQLMRQIAQASGGRSFTATNADDLSSIYQSLGSRLGSVTRTREITAVFALAGVVLLIAAAGMSARSWGQLP